MFITIVYCIVECIRSFAFFCMVLTAFFSLFLEYAKSKAESVTGSYTSGEVGTQEKERENVRESSLMPTA